MSREIKFRSWVKEVRDGDLVLPGFMDYDPVWKDIKAVRIDTRDVEFSPMVDVVKSHTAKVNDLFKPEYNLMQFTGLKDKNGKDVYEGDVLCIPSSYKEPITDEGQGPIEDYNQLKPVIFKDGMFGVETDKDEIFYKEFISLKGLIEDADPFEIIGNIYENPELIKNHVNKNH